MLGLSVPAAAWAIHQVVNETMASAARATGTLALTAPPQLRRTDKLMPGMNCTVKFVAYQKDDALTVPTIAVFADDNDEDQRYVYVPGKDGKSFKKSVKVGKSNGAVPLEPGKSLRYRYRVIIHPGDGNDAGIAGQWTKYSK